MVRGRPCPDCGLLFPSLISQGRAGDVWTELLLLPGQICPQGGSVPRVVLSQGRSVPGSFCPQGRSVPGQFCPQGGSVPRADLSPGRFCPQGGSVSREVLSPGLFCPQGGSVPRAVLSPCCLLHVKTSFPLCVFFFLNVDTGLFSVLSGFRVTASVYSALTWSSWGKGTGSVSASCFRVQEPLGSAIPPRSLGSC